VVLGFVVGSWRFGILVWGTDIGMSMAANKLDGIRAALCHDVFSARATRRHNDANVLALGSRVVGKGLALEIVEAWLKAEFEGGRHKRRVDKIHGLE
jgi:ribose 5-phosphate isomerase B